MKCEYEVNFELVRSWMIENKFKMPRLKFFLMQVVMAAVLILFGIIEFEVDEIYTLFMFCLAFILLFLAFARDEIVIKKQFALMCKQFGSDNCWVRSISFDDEHIIETEVNVQTTYKYSDIAYLEERDDLVLLRLNNGTAIRLYNVGFKDCTPQEGIEFIENHMHGVSA